jgi:hypothetical protein
MVKAATKKKMRINDNRTPAKARKSRVTTTTTSKKSGAKPILTTRPAGTMRSVGVTKPRGGRGC